MNRAVGRGPFVEGPLDFFKIGCGIAVWALEVVDDDVVLGLLWIAVVLEAPGPWRARLC